MDNQDLKTTIERAYKEIAIVNGGIMGAPSGQRAFAYARVSSSGQAEEGRSGLPRQLSNINAKARELNLCIPLELIYYDDHTGFEFRNRPGLQALLTAIKKPDLVANHVVMEYLDRLSRNAKWHQGFLLDLFGEYNIAVHFWKSFGSEIERAVMGAISEEGMRYEIERMTEGTRRKAESGRVTAKTPAYGYLFSDSKGRPATDPASDYRKDTHYIPHPDEAFIIRECYERIVRGDSLYAICNDLNRREVPTAKGARYWETGNLSKIIKNPAYKGEYVANRYYNTKEWSERVQKITRKQRKRLPEEWIITPVPPLVSPELWQTAQEILRQNVKLAMRNAKGVFLLQGFLKCAKCGQSFSCNSTSRANGLRHFYICRSRQLQPVMREKFSCESPYIVRDDIDAQVWSAVCQVITNPDLIIQYLEDQAQTVIDGKLSDELAYIEREISKCEREENQWDRAFAAEIFSLEEYQDKKSAVATRKVILLEGQEKIYNELMDAREFEEKKTMIHKHLKSITKSGLKQDIPLRDKRRILGLLVDQVTINTSEHWFTLQGSIEGTYSYDENQRQENEESPFFRYTPGL